MPNRHCPHCNASAQPAHVICSQCGAVLPNSAGAQSSSTPGRGLYLSVALLLAAGVGVGLYLSLPKPERTPEEVTRAAVEKAAREESQQEFAARRALTRTAAAALKQSLRDPESLQWISRQTNRQGTLFCGAYRAKNGFGGYTPGLLVIDSGSVSTEATTWADHCKQPSLYNIDDEH